MLLMQEVAVLELDPVTHGTQPPDTGEHPGVQHAVHLDGELGEDGDVGRPAARTDRQVDQDELGWRHRPDDVGRRQRA